MGRKIASILASGLFLISGTTWALALGKYQLNSYLNEPLDMEVELLQIRDLTPEELRISLAKPADFENAGLDRIFFLNDLKFEVTLDEDAGTGQVKVTSSKPVREPFLNFLMEVHWPSGRLLREYTLLLDSRSYAANLQSIAVATTTVVSTDEVAAPGDLVPAQEEAVSVGEDPAVQDPTDQVVVAPEPTDSTAEVSEPKAIPATSSELLVVSQPVDTSQDAGSYEVQNDDTMWRIALASRQSTSMSVQQTMLAIQRLNPDAFIDGNINLLKKGQVLRIPTEQQARSMQTREALSEVAEQNAAWEDMLRSRGIAIPTSPQASSSSESSYSQFESAPAQGEVTLIATDAELTTESGAASGMSSDQAGQSSEVLQNELTITEEKLDAAAQENQRLSSSVGSLEGQLETSRSLISVKDSQIAQLQAQLQAAREGQPSPVDNDVVETIPLEDTQQEVAAQEPQVQPVLTLEDINPGGDSVSAKPSPATEEPAGLMTFVMNNLLLVAGSIAALLAVIVGLLMLGRRKNSDSDFEQDESQLADFDESDESGDSFMAGDFSEEPEDQLLADDYATEGDLEPSEQDAAEGIDDEPFDSQEESFPSLDDLEDELASSDEDSIPEDESINLENEPAVEDVADEEIDLEFGFEEEADLSAEPASSELESEEDLSLDFELGLSELGTEESTLELAEDDISATEYLEDLSLDFEVSEESATMVDLPVDETSTDIDVAEDDLSLDFELSDESATLVDLPVDESPAGDDSETLVGMPALDEELVVNELDDEINLDDDELEFLDDADENATKLDLAKAYIDMGDLEGAGGILDEVLKDGDDDQKAEAQNLMEQVK